MNLKELTEYLESKPQDLVLRNGFHEPHSWRGSYYELAFEPAENVTIASMLACCKEANGAVYEGYKGGDFKMHDFSDCYLANYGECGDGISALMLDGMILQSQFQWQPIETAPKDFARFIGCVDNGESLSIGVCYENFESEYIWIYDLLPTHWMPLPEFPAPPPEVSK